jgi:hypothetical protein
MAKDLGAMLQGFGKDFMHNLGNNMSGMSQVGGPMSSVGILGKLMGGGGDAPNPGEKMFGMTQSMDSGSGGGGSGGSPNFMSRFGRSLSDELFARAMQNMGGMGGY